MFQFDGYFNYIDFVFRKYLRFKYKQVFDESICRRFMVKNYDDIVYWRYFLFFYYLKFNYQISGFESIQLLVVIYDKFL